MRDILWTILGWVALVGGLAYAFLWSRNPNWSTAGYLVLSLAIASLGVLLVAIPRPRVPKYR
jgi:hypothetical protein